jgi:hypothetical protein
VHLQPALLYVEGATKFVRSYKKLMMNRMKWTQAVRARERCSRTKARMQRERGRLEIGRAVLKLCVSTQFGTPPTPSDADVGLQT